MAKTTKAGGAKLNRTQTVTIRLDPKTRYLVELAARTQRRTVSSFIEWAVEESFKNVQLASNTHSPISAEAQGLWDVDEPDRLAKLALTYPHLLTHDEQVLWKLITENGLLWRGEFKTDSDSDSDSDSEWAWEAVRRNLIFERLREYWETFVAVASGELDKSELPEWEKTGPPTASQTDNKFVDDMPL